MKDREISKLISYALRHNPAHLGLNPDEGGWVFTADLLDGLQQQNPLITLETLRRIVETNDKQRFAWNNDQSKIRASQGHSIQVSLDLPPVAPPELLYHGTVAKNLQTILAEGIKKMSRQHVHLSADLQTAKAVGSRHGRPVLLVIAASRMHHAGHSFYLSDNKVWLTDEVPASYITVLS